MGSDFKGLGKFQLQPHLQQRRCREHLGGYDFWEHVRCPVIVVCGQPLLSATNQLKGPSYKALKQRHPYLRTEGTLREGEPKQGEASLVAVAETSPNFGSSEYLLRSRHLTALHWLPRGYRDTSLFSSLRSCWSCWVTLGEHVPKIYFKRTGQEKQRLNGRPERTS